MSAAHRVVTNSSHARTTVVTLISPDYNSIIQPAEALVNNNNNPHFIEPSSTEIFKSGDIETVLEPFKFKT